MTRALFLPAGTRFEVRVERLPDAAPLSLALETLDPSPWLSGRHRVRVLAPGAPDLGFPAGRRLMMRIRRGGHHGAERQRQVALVQGLIREAAGTKWGAADAIAEPLAVFHDPHHAAFGTLEEWTAGRYWRMELDDCLFDRPKPSADPDRDDPALFRTEYCAKRLFMARLVKLLREIGAEELARRYDWANGISQRRVLKRDGFDPDPMDGWTAVAFDSNQLDQTKVRHYVTEASPWLAAWEKPAPVHPGSLSWTFPASPPPPAPQRVKHGWRWIVRLLYRPEVRHEHLGEEIDQGLAGRMLTVEEADRIRRQACDPMLQTYLKCLAVHLAMLPVTNLVVLAAALWYSLTRDLSFAEGAKVAALTWAFFAIAPVSPGSIGRGLFVIVVGLRRRSFKGLRLAAFLSFWRWVGYMAFPLQMVSAYPALARFLAARWSMKAVHMVPAYGQPGSLLEHRVFDLTFNLPLTLARRWRMRHGKSRAA